MGRKSKLTDDQWEEIRKRILNGEGARSVARDYDIAESSIREKISTQVSDIRHVADQLVEANTSLLKLPITSQITAQVLAATRMSINFNLLQAANNGSMTAVRLSAIANEQMDKVDSQNPEKSQEVLQSVAVLSRMANEASQIPINLIKANKEAMAEDSVEEVKNGLTHFYGQSES